MDRRTFVRTGLGALAGGSLLGCGGTSTEAPERVDVPRLTARPLAPDLAASPGITALGLGSGRDGFLSVPEGYDGERRWPLLVLLHGAGGGAAHWRPFASGVAEDGIVALAVDSRAGSWDVLRGGFGPDVRFLDDALDHAFRRVRVDPARIGLAGFSDGASYALSLGLPNGDLFTGLVAFSPGFMVTTEEHGLPRIFVSHGRNDGILSFAASEQRIVPALREAGYDVTFRPFDGGHVVPSVVADEAVGWFLG